MMHEFTAAYAEKLDTEDPLSQYRNQYYIPIFNGRECIYFTGNSLGLQPKTTQEYVLNELEDWASFGVEGHFHARTPWKDYHEIFPEVLCGIVGALPEEVVVMNQLTVNLHVLLTSFYRPTSKKYKILCEAKAFPSDQYAFASQVALAGHTPADAIIEVKPRDGEVILHTEDIIAAIEANKDSLACIFFSGVNYYTGQLYDMQAITASAHEYGIPCGFDLAHAAGNVKLSLHEWMVDFACWCSYKYLNSGPGAVSGVFIHENHITDPSIPRLAGWWGHNKESRFKMGDKFDPIPTAEGWQLSNAPVLSMAAHKAALDIFHKAGMDALVNKSQALFNYTCLLINKINAEFKDEQVQIITPQQDGAHGCQLSLVMKNNGKKVFDELTKAGVLSDWREPNVVRIAPVPMYNSFTDVYQFATLLKSILTTLQPSTI